MTISNVNGASAGSGLGKTNQVSNNRQSGGRKTADDVLASLREMMPGWTISTSSADWGEGMRNIQIDRNVLQAMADDPREFEKYKSMILDLENTVSELEEWKEQNPGQSLIFDISLDPDGNARATATIRTLLGVEQSASFDLPSDRASWGTFIRETLDALSQGEDSSATKSWIA
ncbi:MAG: hypothetical protein FWB97_01220 [Oscillospiraceae bacterium]|nr:hypothetical protein [Oscillospiraceae bacterium]